MKPKLLKAGDVRQEGDQQREIQMVESWHNPRKSHTRIYASWEPVKLIGHAILPADLCHLQFYRP